MERLLHGREEVFEDAAGAEVDFGGDLHARREAELDAVGVEGLA